MPIQEFTRPAATLRAVQWTGDNLDEIAELVGNAKLGSAGGLLTVDTTDGPFVVQVGWLVYVDGGQVAVCSGSTKRRQSWELR